MSQRPQKETWPEKKKRKKMWKELNSIEEAKKQKTMEETHKQERCTAHTSTTKHPKGGRPYTVAVALPGSILDNAQTPQLRMYLAGQIARAAVVFSVDEIVIYDESCSKSNSMNEAFTGIGKKKVGNCNVLMVRVLQYMECPQYLRKSFFPQHPDLQYAGLLNPLACPHHVSADADSPYREGVVVNKPGKEGKGSVAYVGLQRDVFLDRQIQEGLRVTVKMQPAVKDNQKKLKGTVVSPTTPRVEAGLYWGYTVRLANSLGEVFTESPHPGGYDLMVGTSERGDSVDSFKLPSFKNLLIVFGGVKGLEAALDADQNLNVDDPNLLFHHYLNTCPNQGSNTIRTEEAILVTMSALRPQIQANVLPEPS